jgi:hypothetical protein
MFATLLKLELMFLDGLNRDQLIRNILEQRDNITLQFSKNWLEEQSTDCLRLLLLAAKLLLVLRRREGLAPGDRFSDN